MLPLRIPKIWRYILFIWLVLTLININKAYHIDDAFHLEAAENIKAHPLKPMSGKINWDDFPRPMYEHNQPPLFFYLILLNQLLFGQSEIAMHLMLSLFTLLALVYFYKLQVLLSIEDKDKIILLLLLGFCPAFIVNQNLMIDVPVLSLVLSSTYYLIKGQLNNKLNYYIRSALLIGICLLIKYSILPFLVVIVLTAIFSRQYKNALVIFIPILFLAAWSMWNKYEFGGMHLFTRPRTIYDYKLIFGFLATIGSLATFSLIYARPLFFKNILTTIITGIVLCVSLFLIHKFLFKDRHIDHLLNTVFITNGILLFVVIGIKSIQLIIKTKKEFFSSPSLVFILAICGVSIFMTVFAPFNATRHVLIIIPFFLLFGQMNFKMVSGKMLSITVGVTILLGVLLGISDWKYADFYRSTAKSIDTKNGTYWSLGHWGWKWYSKKAGMKIYSTHDLPSIKKGDYIISPLYVPKQQFPSSLTLETVKVYSHQTSLLTYFSVHNARFYNSSVNKPSWTFSTEPYDQIYLYRVK